MVLIKSIEELQKYITIAASKNFGTYEMFVRDAQEKYIEPYFGHALLKTLESKPDDELRERICRALAPFSLALATDELSINFGESGHTVTRTDTKAPASDAKIEKATRSLFERAWLNLDRAIKYVIAHTKDYPEWKKSDFAHKKSTFLFKNADDFQENGLVDIDNSPLTFFHIRLLVLRIERSETLMFLPAELRGKIAELPEGIIAPMQAYTGSRAAALHTSQATHANRSKPGFRGDMTEFKPVIRPLYTDIEQTGNYFAEQADFWKSSLIQALIENGNIDADAQALRHNTVENKVFIANALPL